MKKQDCTNCKWAEWKVKPSGRRDLSFGKCNVPCAIPNSFMSFYRELPSRSRISKHTKPNCVCWEKI